MTATELTPARPERASTEETTAYECTVWWCTNSECRGEHHAYVGEQIPATADALPRASRHGGFYSPGITISVGWNTIDRGQPNVWLHIGDENLDAEAHLHPHEARQVAETLLAAIAELEGRRP